MVPLKSFWHTDNVRAHEVTHRMVKKGRWCGLMAFSKIDWDFLQGKTHLRQRREGRGRELRGGRTRECNKEGKDLHSRPEIWKGRELGKDSKRRGGKEARRLLLQHPSIRDTGQRCTRTLCWASGLMLHGCYLTQWPQPPVGDETGVLTPISPVHKQFWGSREMAQLVKTCLTSMRT